MTSQIASAVSMPDMLNIGHETPRSVIWICEDSGRRARWLAVIGEGAEHTAIFVMQTGTVDSAEVHQVNLLRFSFFSCSRMPVEGVR